MKYIKLFMLLAVVSVFVACSSDDDYNTNETTVSFASDAITTKESAGIINIPIMVTGLRNGSVNVTVKAEEVGANPAKEDVNYLITSKNINLNADDAESATMNVEVKMVDDNEINENRTFKLTIVSVNGAQLGANASTTITIRDNDAAFYEKFFGKWKLSGTLTNFGGSSPINQDVTISGETDEDAPNYEKLLTMTIPKFNFAGVPVDCGLHLRYSFDKATKKGKISIICNEQLGTYGPYSWILLTDDGTNLTDDDVVAEWELGEGDKFPSEITFPEDATLHFYENAYTGGANMADLSGLKLTKK